MTGFGIHQIGVFGIALVGGIAPYLIVKSATADDSKQPRIIRVAIYSGAGVTRGDPAEVKACLPAANGFDVKIITEKGIRDGGLEQFDVVIHPGGSGSGQAKALGDEGRERVRQFVSDGGGFVGICAGAYLASAEYPWALKLLNARVVDDEHWARGVGKVMLRLPKDGRAALGTDEAFTTIHYENGPLLGPADHKDIPNFESLATFETEIRKNAAPKGIMKGTTAIARGRFGEGRVVCFSPHPEKTRGREKFVTETVGWAAGLTSEVGQEVTLRGRFGGPGKIADYITTYGEPVYLMGYRHATEYGEEVIVRGKLQRYAPPPADASLPDPNAEPRTGLPEHYFIRSAEVVVVPAN